MAAQYISASRRTDIPRFFSAQFFAAWEAGSITYDGGYGRCHTVSLRPDDVLGYVFWSKDFAPFLDDPRFKELLRHNNAVFHFTINDAPALEPHVPPLDGRLETLRRLCCAVGPERVLWRYDPVVKYRDVNGAWTVNDRPFFHILPRVAALGIRRCYFSFMTPYAKLRGRGVVFGSFSGEEKRGVAAAMLAACQQAGMTLHNCCNQEVLSMVPGIRQARCVDAEVLASTDRFGVHRALKEKPTRTGCGCHESRDVGSYAWACPHGCAYCYANPGVTPSCGPR